MYTHTCSRYIYENHCLFVATLSLSVDKVNLFGVLLFFSSLSSSSLPCCCCCLRRRRHRRIARCSLCYTIVIIVLFNSVIFWEHQTPIISVDSICFCLVSLHLKHNSQTINACTMLHCTLDNAHDQCKLISKYQSSNGLRSEYQWMKITRKKYYDDRLSSKENEEQ